MRQEPQPDNERCLQDGVGYYNVTEATDNEDGLYNDFLDAGPCYSGGHR